MILGFGENVYLTGGVADDRIWTVEIAQNGQRTWLSRFQSPGAGPTVGTAITLDSANKVYVTGYSPGIGSGNDIVTIKYDNNGVEKWVMRYNGPANGDDIATGLVVDKEANIYVTGYSATADGGTEFVTIKYTQLDNIQKQPDGTMRLKFFTIPGSIYGLEATTNFQSWLPIATNTADTNGLVQFDDTNAPSIPYRFYRGNSAP